MAPEGCFSPSMNANRITDYRRKGPVSVERMPPAAGPAGLYRDTSAPRHLRTLSRSCQDVTVAGHVTDTLSDVLTGCQRPVCIALLDIQPPLAYRTLPLLHHSYEDCFQMA